jgi:hypothetical protein
MDRAFGDVYGLCTRNRIRKRLQALVADVEEHLGMNAPGNMSC